MMIIIMKRDDAYRNEMLSLERTTQIVRPYE